MSSLLESETRRRLIEAVQAHQAGELDAAETGYRAILVATPDQPDALHYLGMALYQKEDYPQALEHVSRARALKPDDPAIAANLGLVHQALGQIAEAEMALRSSLALEEVQPEAWYNLGLCLLAARRPADAGPCFERALKINPGHFQARRQLGVALLNLGQAAQAAEVLAGCVAALPADPGLQLEYGLALERDGRLEAAATAFERAADPDTPVRPQSLARLSVARRRLGRLDDAMAAAREAVDLYPGSPDAHRSLGQCLKEAGELGAAGASFRRAHALLRFPDAGADPSLPTFTMTTRAKLRHDAEQFRWLIERGIDEERFRPALASCEDLLAGLPNSAADGEVFPIPGQRLNETRHWYNRCLRLAEAPRMPDGPFAAAVDPAVVETDYYRRGPGLAWIDDFLKPEALALLRQFCLESTIWYDWDHPNGYLGAYLPDGFAAPLFLQIAEELAERLPGIFGRHRLLQLWAYKYDSRLSGIDMHADFAAINVNFWITPSESNQDPDSGGMVIWDAEAPREWTLDEYNTYDPQQQSTIRQFLEDQGAKKFVVPHRQNRCVIFNSDLFHKTDDINFRDAYEDRRINVTMLFGQRLDA
jgi:tetratricopeptide (TPR) repeat protein